MLPFSLRTLEGAHAMRVSLWFAIAALVISGLAAVYDVRTGRVPNWLTLTPLPFALVLHAIAAQGAAGAFGWSGPCLQSALSLVGAVGCAVVPFIMWRARLMGGADWKLLATVGALLTARAGVEAELVALVLAAYFGLARLAFGGRLLKALGRTLAFVASPLLPARRRAPAPAELRETVRFSPFVFLGTFAVLVVRGVV